MKKLIGKDENGNLVKLCHDKTLCDYPDLDCLMCEFSLPMEEMKPFKKFKINEEYYDY